MGRLLLLFALLPLALTQKKDYTGHRLISVHAQNKDDVETLAKLEENEDFEELDFWTDPSIVRPTDIRVSPNDYGKLRPALSKAKLIYTVTKENIQEMIDEEAQSMARRTRNSGCEITQNYCTLDQINTLIFNLQSTYPNRVAVSSIGNSYEGRPIYVATIASDLNNEKPSIWIEGGTHPREWISISSAVNLIQELAKQENAEAIHMLDHFDWHVVYVHNPDGYVYSHNTDRLWRKNRQYCNSWATGTDLNRNWALGFGGASSSNNCGSSTYRGQYAFSAPETEALRQAVEADMDTNTVYAFFSIHSYSQLMLLPYAYTSTKPSEYGALYAVADYMMYWLEDIDNRYFTIGTPPDILYAAGGGAYDYFFDIGIDWSYTYELRPDGGTSNGFVLPENQIQNGVDELFISLWAFVDYFYQDQSGSAFPSIKSIRK